MAPQTDNGTVPSFKYSFDLAHKENDSGGWTRLVTVRELAASKTTAGVETRLFTGGARELHWHVSAEWAFMIYGFGTDHSSGRTVRSWSTMYMRATCGCFRAGFRIRSGGWRWFGSVSCKWTRSHLNTCAIISSR